MLMKVQILTDWQSASRNFFAIQPMKMMEAEKEMLETRMSVCFLDTPLWLQFEPVLYG